MLVSKARLTCWHVCVLARSINLPLESQDERDHVGRLQEVILGVEDLLVGVGAARLEEVEERKDEVTVEMGDEVRCEVVRLERGSDSVYCGRSRCRVNGSEVVL